jgi:FkbM family methyltransferase
MNRFAHLVKTGIRRSANLLGYDIVGHDGKSPRWRMAQFLMQSAINTVFDVGANRGEYGWELRELGFYGKIVSFEPLKDAYRLLAASAKADPHWNAVNIGLGDKDEQRILNVAANSESSSFLPMLAAHQEAAPESRYLKEEMATIRRLDSIFSDYATPEENIFLKIDAQGFEKHILDGSKTVLESIPLIQLECSLVPLYGEVEPIEGLISYLRSLGYAPIDQKPTFYHCVNHHLMQADFIFLRQ